MYVAAVFLPLLASVLAGMLAFARAEGHGKHKIDAWAQWLTSGALLTSMALAMLIFNEVVLGKQPVTIVLFTWMQSGSLDFAWALRFDALSAVMLIVVTTVSAMVHVYSIGYMHHDPSIPRFMSYLSLFTFFMLMLVTADNLVQM
ncbi:MAG: NADH-quinone oxidoreductase subunit L, partial [Magnetospirillum sp. WYHS-4]